MAGGRGEGPLQTVPTSLPWVLWQHTALMAQGEERGGKTRVREEGGGQQECVTEVGETFSPCYHLSRWDDSEFFLKSFKMHLRTGLFCAQIFSGDLST